MGGKSGGTMQISRYSMSMHVGVCASGSTLQLLEVKTGDKTIWKGVINENDIRRINEPDLYGGDKKEGGVSGLMWWLRGDGTQVLPFPLANRLGRTSANCPGFRGLASLFFTGAAGNEGMTLANQKAFPSSVVEVDPVTGAKTFLWKGGIGWVAGLLGGFIANYRGFYWCANNPYMKTISARVRRAPEGLNPPTALIQMPDASDGTTQYAANPAHIIFEAMTNTDWGMGESLGAMDIGAFEECAQTLYDEGFGMNMIWNRQSKIEDFIGEVLSHIQGALFVNPATGKHTLKLLRADYTIGDLLIVNPDNARLSNFKRKMWAEIANEITVTWTNPETSKEESVTVQDGAAIAMQGGVSSDSRNYYGIASRATAIAAAERDLSAVVHPLATCEAEVSREFWATVTYDAVRLTWPKYGVGDSVFRVSEVRRGATDRTVVLSLYEDVFGLATGSYLEDIDSGWEDDSGAPEPISRYKLGTAPAYMMVSTLPDVNDASDLVYPEAMSLIAAGRNYYSDTGYLLYTYGTNANGQTVRRNLGDRPIQEFWSSNIAIPAEANTVFTNFTGILGADPEIGGYVLFGNGSDADTELGIVQDYDEDVGWTIRRGILDTTPKAWPIGTPVFFFPSLFAVPDQTRRAASETARYHLATITPNETLPLEAAPEVQVVLSDRAHLPLRPAGVNVEGVYFSTYNHSGSGNITVNWNNRNRVTEATQILGWFGSSVTGEPGQETVIKIFDTGGTEVNEISGLSGTSYDLEVADFMGLSSAVVQVLSRRDGLDSLQGHRINVNL